MEKKYKAYNEKCKMICFRFRKEKDNKYIQFLKDCPNKTQFLRDAIDRELSRS